MEKFSVRKPYTILVTAIAIVLLGVVALRSMALDLLPSMSLPYMIVITTYPGASPERVENVVTEPLEAALGTVSHVKDVLSVSSENYSMVELEFEDGTDMDSALVKVSSAVNQVSAGLPEICGTPSLLELSMDMVATMYVSVSREGYDIYELSDYVSDVVKPQLERVNGVASVTSAGLVEKSVQVELNSDKIDRLNDRVLAKTYSALDDARKQLDDAQAAADEGQALLEEQEASFGQTLASGIFSQIDAGSLQKTLKEAVSSVEYRLDELLESLADASGGFGTSSDLSEDLEELRRAYEKVSSEAAELMSSAQQISQDITPVISDLRTIIEETTGLHDEEINNAEQAAAAALEQAFSLLDTPLKDLIDAQIDAMADAAVNAVETVLPSLAGTEAEAALRSALKSSLESVRADAQDVYMRAEEAQAEAERLLEQISSEVKTAADVYENTTAASVYLRDEKTVNRLKDAASELKNAASALDISSVSSLAKAVTKIIGAMAPIREILESLDLESLPANLREQIIQLRSGLNTLDQGIDQFPALLGTLETVVSSVTQGQLDASLGFSEGMRQLADAQQQLSDANKQYESARSAALKNANVDSLIDASTLAQLIYAQNFSMPAGYIDDENDQSWLLKVGDEFETTEDIADALLADIDGIGTVRLADIADITVIDNADDSFTRINGEYGVVLSVYKSSTAGTNAVSTACLETLSRLEAEDEGSHFVTLMDQGDYITMIIRDLLRSMALGALLAIIILALFLRDIRPTIMVGISIPLSVLFCIVLMYFSGLSMNIMTLGGLSLGIGMLVDNSIVVMENIIRLRQRGMSPARAAVQGSKQVSGAIISSTLTTVCVFLPMVFTKGTVRELLVPMALSITYCLVASLIVAMTVIPASSSVIMRKIRPKKEGVYDRILDRYGRLLNACLNHKLIVIAGAAALLVVCVLTVFRMGIVILPDMTADNIQMSIATPKEMTREESYALAEKAMERVYQIDGIAEAGIMNSADITSLLSSASGTGQYGSYICYLQAEEGSSSAKVKELCEQIEAAVADLPGKYTVDTSGMSELESLYGNGMEIKVFGPDEETLEEISEEVISLIDGIEGFGSVSNGAEKKEKALHLVIDRDRAMSLGLTVAQIYSQLAAELQTEVNSTTISDGGRELAVTVLDNTDRYTRENLLDMEFETTSLMAQAGAASDLEAFGTGGDDASSESTVHYLYEFARLEETTSPAAINRENQKRYITVTAKTEEDYNTTLLNRELQPKLDELNNSLPRGYSIEVSGETTEVSKMIRQMLLLLVLGLALIYFVMVAQFQSLLSPFIILFTIPLAFTGGMLGLMISRQQLSLMALMGFLVLIGTVVNNGIVFVDYANKLRIGGMETRDALVATGKTRMRPILMTTLTTVLAMMFLIFGTGMGTQMSRGMATVIAGGLIYATLMTLFIVPSIYELLHRRKPLDVDVGDDINDAPDDAAEFIEEIEKKKAMQFESGDQSHEDL